MKMINGYYENWRMPINPGAGETRDPSYYRHDIASLTHVFYSFLCLDQRPNPDLPAKKHWNGATADTQLVVDLFPWTLSGTAGLRQSSSDEKL